MWIQIRHFLYSFVVLFLALMTGGCSTAVQSAGLNINPVTGSVGGEIVFKNGRWQRVPYDTRYATRDMCAAPAVRAIEQPCVPELPRVIFRAAADAPCETRALRDPCGDGRALVLGAEGDYLSSRLVDSRLVEVVDVGGGVRGLTGPLVSVRGVARAVAATARAIKEDERETFRALREVHEAEVKRLDTIVHASSQTAGARIRRVFTGTPCELPLAVTPAAGPVEVVTIPAPSTSWVQPSVPATPAVPLIPVVPGAPNVSELQPGAIAPPSAGERAERAVGNLETRVGALESDVKKILALLEKK